MIIYHLPMPYAVTFMLFRKKKKGKNDEEEKTLENELKENLNKINGELLRLEESKKKGEISEENYIEMRKRLESLKREIENMLNRS